MGGMVHCGKNFDHIVMTEKKSNHELVTNGIYAYLRHPSYFGWFYWTVCSQLLLANPICTIGFAVAAHKFFSGRIPPEEHVLAKIYGQRYLDYASRTPIGIPFVSCMIPYTG